MVMVNKYVCQERFQHAIETVGTEIRYRSTSAIRTEVNLRRIHF